MTSLTVHIPDDVAAQLASTAESLDRSKSYVAAQAIKEFVEREAWFRAEMQAGLDEANRGEFASDEEVRAAFDKFRITPKSKK